MREHVFAAPVLFEKGLFVHAYGPDSAWREGSQQLKVDLTAMRPIILQNIHFVDPATGETYNNRTA